MFDFVLFLKSRRVSGYQTMRHKLLINNSIKGNTNYKAKRTTQKGNQKHKLR